MSVPRTAAAGARRSPTLPGELLDAYAPALGASAPDYATQTTSSPASAHQRGTQHGHRGPEQPLDTELAVVRFATGRRAAGAVPAAPHGGCARAGVQLRWEAALNPPRKSAANRHQTLPPGGIGGVECFVIVGYCNTARARLDAAVSFDLTGGCDGCTHRPFQLETKPSRRSIGETIASGRGQVDFRRDRHLRRRVAAPVDAMEGIAPGRGAAPQARSPGKIFRRGRWPRLSIL